MAADTFYISTPIYYVNDVPHLGHAYTTIVADAFARYHRRLGRDTWFLTGTDEHGQKIERAASAQGLEPIELADRVVERFRGLWQDLGIHNDDFIRTTEPRHHEFVQWMWRQMQARGDIYKDTYAGLYCVGCEGYYTDKDVVDGRCPMGHNQVEERQEETYFFKLSAYQGQLLALYDGSGEHAGRARPFVQPAARLNEVRSFVAGGLQDLSISRTTIRWGVPVPDDPAHVVYVWLDALSNYVSALRQPEPGREERFWPAQIHLIGKDILRFHAVYWPAFLMSAGLPVPECVLAHGWWTVEGQKMSKSLRNVVDPHFLIEEYGRDVVRYFVLREVPLGQDGDFSHRNLLGRLNADLANDLGNLLSRTLGMLQKYRGGVVPAVDGEPDAALAAPAREAQAAVRQAMSQDYLPSRALEQLWQFIGRANLYVDEQAPWTLAKEGRDEDLDRVLAAVLLALARIARMLDAFMPDTAAQMLAALGLDLPADWRTDDDAPLLARGQTLARPEPLFPRLDAEALDAQLAKIEQLAAPAAPASEPAPAQEPVAMEALPEITIDQFFAAQLIVGEVLAAEAVPKSSKLLKLQVTLGEPEPRQIVAGIAKSYDPATLVGQRVLVVANLAPAKLMGIESQGMVLAAETTDGSLKVITPDPSAPVGTRVK